MRAPRGVTLPHYFLDLEYISHSIFRTLMCIIFKPRSQYAAISSNRLAFIHITGKTIFNKSRLNTIYQTLLLDVLLFCGNGKPDADLY